MMNDDDAVMVLVLLVALLLCETKRSCLNKKLLNLAVAPGPSSCCL